MGWQAVRQGGKKNAATGAGEISRRRSYGLEQYEPARAGLACVPDGERFFSASAIGLALGLGRALGLSGGKRRDFARSRSAGSGRFGKPICRNGFSENMTTRRGGVAVGNHAGLIAAKSVRLRRIPTRRFFQRCGDF